jgi:hypothetical protein
MQLAQRVPGNVELTLGGRVDCFSLIDLGTYFSPRASLIYSVTPLTTLGFSAGVCLQNPSYIWLVASVQNKSLHAFTHARTVS